MISNPQLLAKIFEGHIIKLASIVRDEYPRNSKAAYYILTNNVSNISLSDSCHGLHFHPFCKVINSYNQKLHLSCPHGKGTMNVKSPLGKGPRGHHWS